MTRVAWSARERWLCAALIVLAWALRAWTVVEYERAHPQADAPVIDERSYDRWARELAAGDWIGHEVYFQEPLYPYWLGGVYVVSGGSRSAARHAQAAFGALTVALVYALARRLAGARAAFAAALLLALYPPHWHLAALLLKENLFLPCVAAIVWCGVRARESASVTASVTASARARGITSWAIVGALAAAGALLRGNVLVLLPLVVAWPWLAAWSQAPEPRGWRASCARALRDAWPSMLGVALGVALLLAPVALRNWHVGRVFALSTSGAGTNVYGGNNAQNPWGVATEFDWVRGIPEHEAGDWKHEAERRVGRTLLATEVSSYWMEQAWKSMREHPSLHASIFWNKLRLTLGPYEVPDNHCLAWDAHYVAPLRAPLPGFALLGWLGLCGLALFVVRRREPAPHRTARAKHAEHAEHTRRDGAELAITERDPGTSVRDAAVGWALVVAALAYLATIVLTVTSDRIRLGLVPLLAPLAGYACVEALALRRQPLRVLACAAFAALLAWTHAQPRELRDKDLLERDYNQASYWVADPARRPEARALAERVAAAYPNSSRVLTLLAEIDWRDGSERLSVEGVRGDAQQSQPILATYYEPALDRLKIVLNNAGVNARERYRAQRLVGLIQTDLGRHDAAERRFREALAFDPADADLRARLAQSLVLQAAKLDGEQRAAKAREALECLDSLTRGDALVEALRARALELSR